MKFLDSIIYQILKIKGFVSSFKNTSVGVVHSLEKKILQSKETLVLVHGIGANASHYARVMVELEKHGYSVLAPDLLGHGLSEDPGKNISGQKLFQALSDWLNQVPAEKFILVGNSLGGALSLKYTIQFPERVKKLILISPAGGFENEWEWEKFKNKLQFKSKEDTLKYLNKIYHKKPFYLPFFADPFFRIMSKESIQSLIEKGRFEDFELGKTASELSSIFPPTLFIWGGAEKIFPKSHLQWFKKNLPSSVIFDETKEVGHCPQIEKSGWLCKRVLKFISCAVKPRFLGPGI